MAGIPPLPNLKLRHPRALRLSPSLPATYERGGLPFPALPPSDAHVAFWRYGSRSAGRPCPLHYPGPLDPWPTLADCPVPGVPSTRYSPFNSHAPSRSMDSCTPPNRFHAFSQHQQQNDLLLVNLTNPLTNITLTPGSLWWDSLLPSTHSFAPCIPHSLHSLTRAR